MQIKKNLFYSLQFLTALFLLSCIFTSCHRTYSTARELFQENYYDWSYPSDYSFYVNEEYWEVADIHTLSEDEMSVIMAKKISSIRIQWNSAEMLASESNVQEKSAIEYYLVEISEKDILLIPMENNKTIFEGQRPLAMVSVPSSLPVAY